MFFDKLFVYDKIIGYFKKILQRIRQSVKDKIFYKEQWLQNAKDENKALTEGKLQKEDDAVLIYLNFSPIFLEMGKEGYTFQESRYLMSGKLESKVVYKPKDYKYLLNHL